MQSDLNPIPKIIYNLRGPFDNRWFYCVCIDLNENKSRICMCMCAASNQRLSTHTVRRLHTDFIWNNRCGKIRVFHETLQGKLHPCCSHFLSICTIAKSISRHFTSLLFVCCVSVMENATFHIVIKWANLNRWS